MKKAFHEQFMLEVKSDQSCDLQLGSWTALRGYTTVVYCPEQRSYYLNKINH